MTFAVFNHYRRNLRNHPELRAALLSFMLVSFLAAGIAGFFGAMLNKHALAILALKSKRRQNPRPAKRFFPGEAIVFPKRKSGYVQVGRLFHV